MPCPPSFGKRSGVHVFDDHGWRREDPGNEVAVDHADMGHRTKTMAMSDDVTDVPWILPITSV